MRAQKAKENVLRHAANPGAGRPPLELEDSSRGARRRSACAVSAAAAAAAQPVADIDLRAPESLTILQSHFFIPVGQEVASTRRRKNINYI